MKTVRGCWDGELLTNLLLLTADYKQSQEQFHYFSQFFVSL